MPKSPLSEIAQATLTWQIKDQTFWNLDPTWRKWFPLETILIPGFDASLMMGVA